MRRCLALVTFSLMFGGSAWGDIRVAFTFSPVRGIGSEAGVCRRDPSDIIRVGDTWYVWYTRVPRQQADGSRTFLYPSGYYGTIWYATSPDAGHTWVERSEALGRGAPEAFDAWAVFTPNILTWEGRYYLYYTAVRRGFTNRGYADVERTAIGVAVADRPEGPWRRVGAGPILSSTRDPDRFDSFRVDDACAVVRGGRIWLYYKGRRFQSTPGRTRMGVALADDPAGPYVRSRGGRAVQDSGHEVLVWPWQGGVLSLVSHTGPQGLTLQAASDGPAWSGICRSPGPTRRVCFGPISACRRPGSGPSGASPWPPTAVTPFCNATPSI